MAYIYIPRCENDDLYVGSTIDINDRVVRHKSGRGAVYTKHHKPEELIYTEEYDTYQEAFKRERQIKGWSRAKKEALIAGDIEKPKQLSKSKK